MKRRDVLKGLTMTAGALCAGGTQAHAAVDEKAKAKTPLAVPIRALTRKNGVLKQPVKITFEHSSVKGTVITKLKDTELDRRSSEAGVQTFDVFVDPVVTTQNAVITVECDGVRETCPIELKPVRRVLVYVLPHSHHDLGYTDLQANVEEKQMKNIDLGIDLARKTASYPEGARFVWNLEVLWGADLYMQRRSAAEKAALLDAIRKGWIALNGSYANELTGLCRPEELVQLFRYGTELAKLSGTKVDSAMMSDVPGYSWGTVPAMAQAGIRYFSAAPNWFDRIGDFMQTWQDKPFWWMSPSGMEKILVWVPWTGYAMSHVMKLEPEWLAKYQDRLDTVNFPYDISCIRWSGHGDNAIPDTGLCETVKSWNETYEWPKFCISSTSTAFSAFEERYGNQLPRYQGDLTPYWEDGAGSSALETKISRNAADRLTQAAALAATGAVGAYDSKAYNEAWRNVLLYSEHTWGAWCSVSDSENPFTKNQWDVKRGFAVHAEEQANALIDRALGARPGTATSAAIDIHNSTSWDRTEVVLLSRELSAIGDHVEDASGHPVPSQRLSSGELAVLVTKLPAFGFARYKLSSQQAFHGERHVSVKGGVLENGVLRVKVDGKTGNIVDLGFQNAPHNFVETIAGSAANEYLFLEGDNVAQLQRGGAATITVEDDDGPLVASVRIASDAPGCNSLVRHVRMVAGLDYVELSNVVDKKRAALNPNPGKGGAGGEFAQRGSKESVNFAFPFSVPNGKMRMDVPLAEMQPELDQLPGSCKNWLPVGRWVDVSNGELGITWVTLDAPLIEVGGVTATMLGSQRNPDVWRQHIASTQTFYSWVMNNHWGTNYRAYQEGPVTFRYALRPHNGHSAGAATRFAIGLSQPLLPAPASHKPLSSASLVRVEPEDVVAVALKTSNDGKAWILRLMESSGEAHTAKLTFPAHHAGQVWESNLAEESLKQVGHEIQFAGLDLKTLRIERAG